MIIKFADLELTPETLTQAMRWEHNGVNINKVKGESPKYFMIDWGGVNPDDVDLDQFEERSVEDYICGGKVVNNRTMLLKMLRHIEYESEEYLWGEIVDNHRWINDEMYQKQSYEQNFEVWWSMRKDKTYLPVLNYNPILSSIPAYDSYGSTKKPVKKTATFYDFAIYNAKEYLVNLTENDRAMGQHHDAFSLSVSIAITLGMQGQEKRIVTDIAKNN